MRDSGDEVNNDPRNDPIVLRVLSFVNRTCPDEKLLLDERSRSPLERARAIDEELIPHYEKKLTGRQFEADRLSELECQLAEIRERLRKIWERPLPVCLMVQVDPLACLGCPKYPFRVKEEHLDTKNTEDTGHGCMASVCSGR